MLATPEVQNIEERYERRRTAGAAAAARYSLLDTYALLVDQEKDRALVRWMRSTGIADRVAQQTLLEIGCGSGGNLLRFMRLGFRPENLVGNDLLDHRLCEARSMLPGSVRLVTGDALELAWPDCSFDVVCLFTVLSSVLDDAFQERLAAKAWALVKPGGGVLWYDFVYDNPANPDVHGVPVRRVRELFPHTRACIERITLLPPLGRPLAHIHPALYTLANSVSLSRSHIFCWLPKCRQTGE